MLSLHSLLFVSVHLSSVAFASAKETKEICPEVCEPEKCPNVGPIGVSRRSVLKIVIVMCYVLKFKPA